MSLVLGKLHEKLSVRPVGESQAALSLPAAPCSPQLAMGCGRGPGCPDTVRGQVPVCVVDPQNSCDDCLDFTRGEIGGLANRTYRRSAPHLALLWHPGVWPGRAEQAHSAAASHTPISALPLSLPGSFWPRPCVFLSHPHPHSTHTPFLFLRASVFVQPCLLTLSRV